MKKTDCFMTALALFIPGLTSRTKHSGASWTLGRRFIGIGTSPP